MLEGRVAGVYKHLPAKERTSDQAPNTATAKTEEFLNLGYV